MSRRRLGMHIRGITALLIGSAIVIASFARAAWATPGQDPHRQTVPTRPPTLGPQTPTSPPSEPTPTEVAPLPPPAPTSTAVPPIPPVQDSPTATPPSTPTAESTATRAQTGTSTWTAVASPSPGQASPTPTPTASPFPVLRPTTLSPTAEATPEPAQTAIAQPSATSTSLPKPAALPASFSRSCCRLWPGLLVLFLLISSTAAIAWLRQRSKEDSRSGNETDQAAGR
jgi:hypothetical protein